MKPTHGAPNYRDDLSRSMNNANNIDFNFVAQQYVTQRAPEYFVYLFNVSTQNFEVSRPPYIAKMVIPGRNINERYAKAGRLPQPFLMPKGNVDSSELEMVPQDARRIATDIINPDNLTIDQDAYIDPKATLNQGNDLGKKGVFWSLNETPTKEEVDKAYARMEKYYTALLEQARAVEVSDPGSLSKYLGPEHHAAADYWGEEYSWHGKKSRPADCPNCGSRIKEGAAFHQTQEGILCIIDWVKAVRAGVRTKQQAIEAGMGHLFPEPAPVVAPTPKAHKSADKSVPTE